ncbi:MAG: SMC family ATPase [Bacteroidota bacterium]
MILQSLQLEFFKQYSQLNIDFREGLVGIVGRNGAGKSSIFEAVLLCLFGKTTSDKDFYKTSWVPAKTNTILELRFELNQQSYRVRREFRGKAMQPKAYLYDQKDQLLASNSTPVNEAIAQLVGLDKDAFTRSVFSGQKELGILSNTRGEERKRMVRRMVGLDKLDRIQQLLRDDRNTKKREIQGQAALLMPKEALEELRKAFKALEKNIKANHKKLEQQQQAFDQKNAQYLAIKQTFDQLNNTYKQYNSLQSELIKWEKGLESLQGRQIEIKEEIALLKSAEQNLKRLRPKVEAYQECKQEIARLERERQRFDQQQKLLIQRKALIEQSEKKSLQIKQLEPLLQEGQSIKEQLEKVEQEMMQSEQLLQSLQKTFAELQAATGAVNGRIKERKEQYAQIQALGKDAQCPTCLQPLIHSYDQTLERLQAEVAAYEEKELQQLQQQLQATEAKINNHKTLRNQQQSKQSDYISKRNVLREQYKNCKAIEAELIELKAQDQAIEQSLQQLSDLSFNPKQYETATASLQALEPIFLEAKQLEKQLERLAELETHLKANVERIQTGQKGITEKKAALQELNFSLSVFEQTKSQMDQQEEQKEAAQEVVRQQKEVLYRLQQEQTGRRRDLDNQEQIAAAIGNNQAHLQELELLDGIFSDFKNQMLVHIRPTIKETAGQLFQQITKGRYEGIEVDDQFEFHIFENGIAYPLRRFSGGEVDLANLCLRIGIGKAIGELSGSAVAMNFLAFDEIFGSQDDERRFEILLALDLLKEQYRQIYIISHIDTIKDHFPNILEIRKSEEGSKAEWR